MSLIQEALKRQMEEMKGTTSQTPPPPPPPPTGQQIGLKTPLKRAEAPVVPPSPVIPPAVDAPPVQIGETAQVKPLSKTPPPPPPDVQAPEPAAPEAQVEEQPAASDETGKKRIVVIGLIVGVVVVLGLACAVAFYAMKKWKKKPAPASTATATQQKAPVETPKPVVTPPTSDVKPVQTVSQTTTQATSQAQVTTTTLPPPPQKEPVVWPALTLKAILGRGKQGAVMLNDQVVGVNESIQGVKVISIGEQIVNLEYKGEKLALRVGSSTQ